jgi:signal transduction histidine kinase
MLERLMKSVTPPADAGAVSGTDAADAGTPAAGSLRERAGLGLSAKLLILTAAFVMLAEVLIFVPSIANFRVNWLTDRLTAARLAALAADAAPGGVVPAPVRNELLSTARVLSVAIKQSEMRRLLLPPDGPLNIDTRYDLRQDPDAGIWSMLGNRLQLTFDALAVFVAPEGRTILVFGHPLAGQGEAFAANDFVEIVLSEAPLRKAMVRYGLNILVLSIIISVIAAALVYFALNRLLVQPMMRLTRSMLSFSRNPEDASAIIRPSVRTDEIGTAERELAHMQQELLQTLQQKNRLAQLGLAVSKINHDLRNMLASAQLLSDRLTALPDPATQSLAPKLIASLDRAINFCNDTLRFGRAEEAAPKREPIVLAAVLEEVTEGLGLPREAIGWYAEVEADLCIDADRDHLYRILNNLARNAVQAIESQGAGVRGEIRVLARREERRVIVEVRDNGPGVTERAKANLFRAFRGGTRKGGAGLGLAIAAELVSTHGGRLELVESPQGAAFRFEIPDRPSEEAL